MEIRRRSDHDFDDLVALAMRVHESDGYPVYLPSNDYVDFLQRPSALAAWVALDGSDVVGHVALNETTSQPVMELVSQHSLAAPAVFVARLIVDPDSRRRGLGRRLLHHASDEAVALGRPVFLDVVDIASASPAVALYRRAGWEQVGRVTFELADDEISELVFRAPQRSLGRGSAGHVRRALPSDALSVRQCVVEAYEPYIARIGRRPAPMLDDYAGLIDHGRVHVAVGDGELRGVIVAWANGDHFYIDNIATSSVARGTAVGRLLMDWAEDRARREGLREIRLYTNVAMTENVAYYERRSFVETHRSVESGYERIHFTKTL